jgi:ribose transport system permease protein
MGDGDLGPVPAPVVIAIVLLIGGWFVLRSTTFGHAMSALGGNETAARLSGIRVARVKIIAFALNGLLIGLAAVIITGRLRTGAPDAGTGVELQVIAAVLLGGSSFFGGASSMVGTFIGVLFVAVLQNGMNLMGVQVFWQGLVTGVVLIAAVWLGQLRTRH